MRALHSDTWYLLARVLPTGRELDRECAGNLGVARAGTPPCLVYSAHDSVIAVFNSHNQVALLLKTSKS